MERCFRLLLSFFRSVLNLKITIPLIFNDSSSRIASLRFNQFSASCDDVDDAAVNLFSSVLDCMSSLRPLPRPDLRCCHFEVDSQLLMLVKTMIIVSIKYIHGLYLYYMANKRIIFLHSVVDGEWWSV